LTKQFEEAAVGSSITIELGNDINVTRGDMIVKSSELPKEKDINTTVLDSKKLVPGAKYFVQHNTNRVLAKIDSVKKCDATDFSEQQKPLN
jgi:sulfate adenylyltransferase subunit 1